jgi:hypothetical protein
MQHVSRFRNPFLIANGETHAATLDNRELFVWMFVSGRVHERFKTQAADHQLVSDDHLSLDALRYLFLGHALPITQSMRSSEG